MQKAPARASADELSRQRNITFHWGLVKDLSALCDKVDTNCVLTFLKRNKLWQKEYQLEGILENGRKSHNCMKEVLKGFFSIIIFHVSCI